MEIEVIKGCTLDEVKDPTWGTGVMQKRLVRVREKRSGAITEAQRCSLLEEAWRRTPDHGTRSLQGTDEQGRGLLLVFDMYVVEQLSVFKRLRHALRMFKAAITGNVNVSSGVRVVVIK